MAQFLLELLSEEIPARMQVRAKDDLGSLVCRALDEADITYGNVETFGTPRRLVLVIADLATRQPDVDVERKGPRVGAPDKAIDGFKRSLGTETYELTEEEDNKGAFYVARFKKVGRPTAEVLADIVPHVLKDFPWPKSMRWGDHDVRWVRPLHGMLCLLDGAVIPFAFGPVTSGSMTAGHRFHAPEPFEVESVEHYNKELACRCVVLDRDERRNGIRGQAELIAKQHGLRLRDDPGLLEEVTGLVEWPVAVSGSIDKEFMELPPEVLVTSMRAHQKYLALEDESGNLAPRFVAIANLEAKDGGEAIVAGNERVLRARLWDAKFFWDQDRRWPLDKLVPKLDDIVFHAKLGSVGAKARRISALAAWIAEHQLYDVDSNDAGRAALLAKADLVTGMVGEFPELQGVMGSYYARNRREKDCVAIAIRDHYKPLGPEDGLPRADPESGGIPIAVALADKLDTLVGFFAINEKPTGSKDPFALRRAALGIVRILTDVELSGRVIEFALGQAIREAISLYNLELSEDEKKEVKIEILNFIVDRMKIDLRSRGIRHDLISAVFAVGEDNLRRLTWKVEELQQLLETEDGANLLTAYRRASNIVRIEEKRDGAQYDAAPVGDRFVEDAEQDLYDHLAKASQSISDALAYDKFSEAMAQLASLRKPIDCFFDNVVVNVDDFSLRENRLRLLSRIRSALDEVADFSLIEDVVSDNDNRRVA